MSSGTGEDEQPSAELVKHRLQKYIELLAVFKVSDEFGSGGGQITRDIIVEELRHILGNPLGTIIELDEGFTKK